MNPKILTLTKNELLKLRDLYHRIVDAKLDNEVDFINNYGMFTDAIPSRILQELGSFSNDDSSSCLLINGFENQISTNTPLNHDERLGKKLIQNELLLGLMTHCLGQMFGYSSQQKGRVFNDIIPISGQETVVNSSAGSAEDFGLHTEDAFFDEAPDFICWACHRNKEKAGTIFACINDINLDESDWLNLREPEYSLLPNALQESVSAQFGVPIVFGTQNNPKFKINTNADIRHVAKGKYLKSYENLIIELNRVAHEMSFKPGSLIFVNNQTVAHGRIAYKPKSPGNGRWLTRLVVKKDWGRISNLAQEGRKFVINSNSQRSKI